MAVERGCWAAPDALRGADAAAFARRVEDLGYSQLWVNETFGRDPFALAAHLGAVTSTLPLVAGRLCRSFKGRDLRPPASDEDSPEDPVS
ncbi:MAG: LLM class flavin-dependent oxidoreductase [Acidimicrobiia bacterium]|nr:LLM class flavin-dependent oxidoreductase [Acidimicrobiia bacterium]